MMNETMRNSKHEPIDDTDVRPFAMDQYNSANDPCTESMQDSYFVGQKEIRALMK